MSSSTFRKASPTARHSTSPSPLRSTAYDVRYSGAQSYEAIKGADVIVVTAGIPRKPGMSRDDLLEINLKVMEQVGAGISKYAPEAFVICVTNPLDAMVWALQKFSQSAAEHGGGHGRRARLLALPLLPRAGVQRLGRGRDGVRAGRPRRQHGAADPLLDRCRYPLARPRKNGLDHGEAAGRDRAAHARRRRGDRRAPEDRLGLLRAGRLGHRDGGILSASDKKRVLPCAARLQGQYGLDNLYVGVPVVIGAGGVERIIEIDLDRSERAMFDKSVEAVQALCKACTRIQPALA